MDKREALLVEETKIRKLRGIVDFTQAVILHGNLSLNQAQKLVAISRKRALELFPDKEETFDLIYGARFRRILTEKYHLV